MPRKNSKKTKDEDQPKEINTDAPEKVTKIEDEEAEGEQKATHNAKESKDMAMVNLYEVFNQSLEKGVDSDRFKQVICSSNNFCFAGNCQIS